MQHQCKKRTLTVPRSLYFTICLSVQAKRDFSIEMDGETRGVARRLADGLEAQQKLADELERKLALAKVMGWRMMA
jgi:hypothetical protein